MEKERVDCVKRVDELMIEKRLEVVADLSTDSVFEYTIATDCMRYYSKREVLIDSFGDCPVIANYTELILSDSGLLELFHQDDREKLRQLCMDFRSGKPEIYVELRKQYEQGEEVWISVDVVKD